MGSLLAGLLAPFAPAPAVAGPTVEEEGYREANHRLLQEVARLRARLIALGRPARLRAADTGYWERNPLRIEAAVVMRDASPWRGSVLVRAGSRDGIRSGMPVTVGGRYIGTVSRSDPLFSRVRLLTDPGHRVWAAILSEQASGEGCLDGTGSGTLDMHLVKASSGKAGDPVFTAGGSPLVPAGLFVGTVKSLTDVDRDGIAEVEVEPAVDVDEITVVNILVVEDPR